MMRATVKMVILGIFLMSPGSSLAQSGDHVDKKAKVAPTTDMKTAPTAAGRDPFANLKVVIPKDKLPPLTSVRVEDKQEREDRGKAGKVVTAVNSSPRGAAVYYGGRHMGNTPLSMSADSATTPLDVVIKAKGYMTLHTRLRRTVSRSYFFKLTPAKFR